jgi:hypothetical protein
MQGFLLGDSNFCAVCRDSFLSVIIFLSQQVFLPDGVINAQFSFEGSMEVLFSPSASLRKGENNGFHYLQGFLEDAWTGPQILAHHLLKAAANIPTKIILNL